MWVLLSHGYFNQPLNQKGYNLALGRFRQKRFISDIQKINKSVKMNTLYSKIIQTIIWNNAYRTDVIVRIICVVLYFI